jgi:ADP-heptose:LPS heptosyltransferase
VQVFRDNVRDEHHTFELLGGPSDAARADEIIKVLASEFPGLAFRNRCGDLTLRQSVATILGCGEFWGIDSSLLHVARIGGLRCVSYWGPTDPSTRLREGWQIEEKTHYRKIACSPCVHTSETPPCHGDNRCIQALFNPDTSATGWSPIEYPRPRTATAQ